MSNSIQIQLKEEKIKEKYKTKPYIDLFLNNVQKTETCWIWKLSKNRGGYGKIIFRENGKINNVMTHRLSYFIHNKEMNQSMLVCHKCDNPSCVNPKHLFLGTYKDNVDDMYKKGRASPYGGNKNPANGENAGKSRVSKKQVIEMRKRYALGSIYMKQLSKMYKISVNSVCKIINNKTHKY